jgi:hypothetical protein
MSKANRASLLAACAFVVPMTAWAGDPAAAAPVRAAGASAAPAAPAGAAAAPGAAAFAPAGAAPLPPPPKASTPSTSRADAPTAPPSPTTSNAVAALGPWHSADQLDFGEIWEGQTTRRTLSLKATGAGAITAAVPGAPFRISEMRVMGVGGSVGGGGPNKMGMTSPAAIRTVRVRQTSAPWSINANTDEEVQIDVIFEPKFNLFSMAAGQKTTTLKVNGPSPKGNWALSIAGRGMFDGLRVGGTMTIDEKESMVVQGNATFELTANVTATDKVLQGTIHGGSLPAGVSAASVPVSVAPGTTSKVKIPLQINWGSLPTNGSVQNGELVLDSPQGNSKASFAIEGVPTSVSSGFDRSDCGIQRLGTLVQLYPTGRVVLSLSGSNFDIANNRHPIAVVYVGKKPVAWGTISLPFSIKGSTDYHQWDSSVLNYNFNSRMTPADYLAAARGEISWTCGLIEQNPAPF